VYPK